MDTQQLLEAAKTIETLQTMLGSETNQWLPVVAAIGGAFIGGISTLIPNLVLEKRKEKQEKHSIETALVSEVSALLDVIEHRCYIDEIENTITDLNKNSQRERKFAVKIPSHYSQIYQNHLQKIGIIDPKLSHQIIRFHQLIDSAIQDITKGGFIAEHGGNFQHFEELLEIFRTARTVGREITGDKAPAATE